MARKIPSGDNESVADAADRARMDRILRKRREKGAGSLNTREITIIRKHEERIRQVDLRNTLSAISQTVFVELLDTDRKVVLDWESDGMPRNRGGDRRVSYNLFVCLPWLKSRWLDEGGGAPVVNAEARERWELARAEEKEIHVSKLKELLMPVEQVIRERVERIQTVKAGMLALPRRAAPILAAMDDRREIEDRLTGFVVEIIEAFARGDKLPADSARRAKKKKVKKKKAKTSARGARPAAKSARPAKKKKVKKKKKKTINSRKGKSDA